MARKKRELLIFVFLLFFLLLKAGFVLALEINYPPVPGAEPPQVFLQKAEEGKIPSEQIISLYIKYIFNLAIWLTGLISLAVLIIGGLRYLISAGKSETIKSAKEQILAGFLGILILLSAVIVLNVLNPQLIKLKISPPEKIFISQPRYVSPPSLEKINTSINVELPFSRIIEGNIFETYIFTRENRKPRMTKIKELTEKMVQMSKDLLSQNQIIKDKVYSGCKCKNADSEGSNGSCSCDPCKKARNDIQQKERENKEKIDELLKQQKEAETQIKELKTELNRLARAKTFIKNCPFYLLHSFQQFLTFKDLFPGEVREIKFWDDIKVPYWNERNKLVADWATFLCTVGGKILATTFPPSVQEMKIFKVPAETKACSPEAPVGEIIDRTERTADRLVIRMNDMILKSKELIGAVDKFQISVSECTSQLPRCRWDDDDDECKNADPEGACPFRRIGENLDQIKKIVNGIKDRQGKIIEEGIVDIASAKIDQIQNKEKIGILTIIDEIVPKILEDLRKEVRYPMQICEPRQYKRVLLTCQRAEGYIDPKGRVIRICCMEEQVFQECLEECYLEKGQENYRNCLQECLQKKSDEAKQRKEPMAEEIADCRHLLNTYCCSI